MNIIINGVEKTYTSSLTLETLLNELEQASKKVAIEVKEAIIPRSQYKNKLVVDGDKIEIINAVGGG